jgi:hypothetical protein
VRDYEISLALERWCGRCAAALAVLLLLLVAFACRRPPPAEPRPPLVIERRACLAEPPPAPPAIEIPEDCPEPWAVCLSAEAAMRLTRYLSDLHGYAARAWIHCGQEPAAKEP